MKFKERKYKYLTKAMRLYLIALIQHDMNGTNTRYKPLQNEIIELLRSDDLVEQKKESNNGK